MTLFNYLSKGVVNLTIQLLKGGRKMAHLNLPQMPCCVFCLLKSLLLQHPRAQRVFGQEGGYAALSSAIVDNLCTPADLSGKTEECITTCRECAKTKGGAMPEVNKSKRGPDGADDWNTVFGRHFKFIYLVVAIILDCDVMHDIVHLSLDSLQMRVGKGLYVQNIPMLDVVVGWIDNTDREICNLGLTTMQVLLRLNPIAALAFKSVGGLTALSKLVIETSLGRNMAASGTSRLHKAAGTSNETSTSTGRSPHSHSRTPPTAAVIGHMTGSPLQAMSSSVPISESLRESGSYPYCDTLECEMPVGDSAAQDSALRLLLNATKVLVRIAVITSESSASELALLVLIVKKLGKSLHSLCKMSTLWRNGRFANQSNIAADDRFPLHQSAVCMCSNCEVEPAVYECTHHRYVLFIRSSSPHNDTDVVA
jgi:hypothetical protein